MLWTEKYCPKMASQFHIHKTIVESFELLAGSTDLPNLIFHGQSGSGKTVLVRQLLRDLFGPRADSVQMSCDPTSIKVSATRTIVEDIKLLRSPHHIELTPSDYGRNDVHVMQYEMKQLGHGTLGQKLTIVVLNEVEDMSKAAQHALRRTMEKASTKCRFVMCCSNLSQVIDPIKSRCTVVRVPQPSSEELHDLFSRIADKEGFELHGSQAEEIIAKAGRSLRKSLLSLQSCHVKGTLQDDRKRVEDPEWKCSIREIANEMLRQQNAKAVFEIRKKLYELIASCVPPTTLLFTLFEVLMPQMAPPEQHQLIQFASQYDHEIRNGGKAIFHLEAFVVNVMSVLAR